MRQSRYMWLILICMVCMAGTIAWVGPQTAWSALAHGDFAKDPAAVGQRFWNALDARQIDLVYAMFDEEGLKSPELVYWVDLVRRDPLIRLQKAEVLEMEEPGTLRMRVSWVNEEQETIVCGYQFKVRNTEQGWKITELKKLSDQLPVVEGISNERRLAV